MRYLNGRIELTNGKYVDAHLTEPDCIQAGTCVCGFCKGENQCLFGDCRNPLPETGTIGTLCPSCSDSRWKSRLPGHRPSTIERAAVKSRTALSLESAEIETGEECRHD